MLQSKGLPTRKVRVGVSAATPAKYSDFVIFMTPTTGTWVPSSGPGEFDASVVPSPGVSININYHALGGRYLSTNKLLVSGDGCRMEGTFADNEGHSGAAIYTWSAGQP
jgi:hypothetical protein